MIEEVEESAMEQADKICKQFTTFFDPFLSQLTEAVSCLNVLNHLHEVIIVNW